MQLSILQFTVHRHPAGQYQQADGHCTSLAMELKIPFFVSFSPLHPFLHPSPTGRRCFIIKCYKAVLFLIAIICHFQLFLNTEFHICGIWHKNLLSALQRLCPSFMRQFKGKYFLYLQLQKQRVRQTGLARRSAVASAAIFP